MTAGETWAVHPFSSCPVLTADLEYLWGGLSGVLSWPGIPEAASLINVGAGVTLRFMPAGATIPVKDFGVEARGGQAYIKATVVTPRDLDGHDAFRTSLTLVDGTLAVTDHGNYGCVTAGTQVSLSNGTSRRIDALHPGESILAYEPGTPGRTVEATIERVLRHRGSYPVSRLVAGGGVELDVTRNHPILTLEGGYQPVSVLAPGDTVFVLDPVTERFEPRPILAIVKDVSREDVVYNLKTTRGQYVAAGMVVHNKCLAAGSLIDTPHGPRPIEDLLPGDVVWTRVDGARVPTHVTHAYAKTTTLASLPGRWLTPNVRATDNHRLVDADGVARRAGDSALPPVAIEGTVHDLATEAGTYLADGVLVRGGD